MVEIVFTEEDRRVAIAEAERRQADNERKGVRGRQLAPERGQQAQRLHYYGAAGELAVASFLGLRRYLYLERNPVRGSSDLPFDIDVKTRSNHSYDLLLFPDYEISKNYVLVTIQNRRIYLHGFIHGSLVEQIATPIEYVQNRKGLAVKQKDLYPVEALLEYINENHYELF